MSIVTHYYSVVLVFVVIVANLVMIWLSSDILKYQRIIHLSMPMYSLPLGSVIFTGIIMMAAKHLAFSFENVMMIVAAICIGYVEFVRAKITKQFVTDSKNTFEKLKKNVSKLLLIESTILLIIFAWMVA